LEIGECRGLLLSGFGIRARDVSRIASERGQNLHAVAEDGSEYVVKVSEGAAEADAVAFQTAALRHIAQADAGLPTPRVRLTLAGAPYLTVAVAGDASRVMHVLSFLPGTLLLHAPRSSILRVRLGAILARLGLALQAFEHPSPRAHLQWDLQRASTLRELADNVQDQENRTLSLTAIDRFEARAAPVLSRLPLQVIHNDFNLHNVLVSSTSPHLVTGILDFGDMVRAPIVCDLAIGAAYHANCGGEPLECLADFVRGYHSLRRLSHEEIAIVFDLVVTRLASTILITESRARSNPANPVYLLRNHPLAVSSLRRLATISSEHATNALLAACADGERNDGSLDA
jgi:hydroxylysine kinase